MVDEYEVTPGPTIEEGMGKLQQELVTQGWQLLTHAQPCVSA